MDRLAVGEQDHSEVSTGFGNPCPLPDSPVGLCLRVLGMLYHPRNPLLSDYNPVRTLPHVLEIFGGFQCLSALLLLFTSPNATRLRIVRSSFNVCPLLTFLPPSYIRYRYRNATNAKGKEVIRTNAAM